MKKHTTNTQDKTRGTIAAALFGLIIGCTLVGALHVGAAQAPLSERFGEPIEPTSGMLIDTVRFPLWRYADDLYGTDARLTEDWCAVADTETFPEDDSDSEYPCKR